MSRKSKESEWIQYNPVMMNGIVFGSGHINIQYFFYAFICKDYILCLFLNVTIIDVHKLHLAPTCLRSSGQIPGFV